MQIAVCVSGAERLTSSAFTLFVRNLPVDADIDCFGFFWEGGALSDEAALTEALTRKSEGRFRRVEVSVGRNFTVDLNLTVQKYPETNIENTLRMYRGIRRCNDMKLRYEVAEGFRYDHVVRTRADLQIVTDIDLSRFLPLIDDFIIFPENGHWRGGLNDQFAFSSSESMDTYASVVDYIPAHCAAGCPFHPETLLRYHLMTMKKYPLLAPISAQLMRD